MTDKKTIFDLGQFADGLAKAQEDGIDVPILNPENGQPIGLTWRVAGPDSARQRAAMRERYDARVKMKAGTKLSEDELLIESIRYLAASSVSWEWAPGVTWNGEALEFSRENAEMVLKHGFIRRQVDAAAANEAGFIKR